MGNHETIYLVKTDVHPMRINNLTPQSVAAFRLLVGHGKLMSAKMIAEQLGIREQNVYKVLRPLVQRRLVIGGKIIVNSYKARPMHLARHSYINHAAREFDRLFVSVDEKG